MPPSEPLCGGRADEKAATGSPYKEVSQADGPDLAL